MQDDMAECSLEALRLWEADNAANTDTASGSGMVGEGTGGQNEVLAELGRMRTALYGRSKWGAAKAALSANQDEWAKYAEMWENQVLPVAEGVFLCLRLCLHLCLSLCPCLCLGLFCCMCLCFAREGRERQID